MYGSFIRLVRSILALGRLSLTEVVLSLALLASSTLMAYLPFAAKAATVPPVWGYPVTYVLLGAFVVHFIADNGQKVLSRWSRRRQVQVRKAITSLAVTELTALTTK